MASDLVTVLKTQDPHQAQVIKSVLEGAGIPVLDSGESIRLLYPVLVDGLADITLKVHMSREAEARRLIEELESAEESPDSRL